MIRTWLAIAFAIVAPQAAAHATLVATTPGDGARLDKSPAALVFEFDEPVTPLSITLVDARGTRVGRVSKPEVDGARVRLTLDAALPDDGYIASYRIVSADSHVVTGAIAFSIGAHALPAREAATVAGPTPLGVALRALLLAAAFIAAGAAAYLVLIAPFPGSQRTLAVAAIVVVAATLIGIDRKTVEMAGDAGGAHGVAHAPFATAAVLAIAGAVVAWFASVDTLRARRRILLAIAALALPAALAAGGHAFSLAYPVFTVPVLFVHLAGGAFWAGSLVALAMTLRRQAGHSALRRFSSIAQYAVPAAIAAGLVFAALELRSLDNLGASAYGRLVIAKVAVALVLLTIATLNRFVLLQAVERGEAIASRRIERSIAAEIVLIAVLVVLGATLGSTPPPRDGIVRIVESGGVRARIAFLPATRTADIMLEQAGKPLDPAELSIELSNAAAAIGPLERRATRVEAGRYRVDDLPVGARGTWNVVLRVRIDDFTVSRLETTLPLP